MRPWQYDKGQRILVGVVMANTATIIGPADQGRRMSLREFQDAESDGGYVYELNKGTITVTNVPNRRHLAMSIAARRQLSSYDLSHPGFVYGIVGGSDCKILLLGIESERHPDIAVYKTPPPPPDEEIWASWIPELVIEIVSPDSAHRDYVEKREEYLQFGITEYWIIDEDKQQMLALRRAGGMWREKIVEADGVHRTRLLPGLEFNLKTIFDAARATG